MARKAKPAPAPLEKPKRGTKQPAAEEMMPAAGPRHGRKPKTQEPTEPYASVAESVQPAPAPVDAPAIEELPKARRGRKPKQVEATETPAPDVDMTSPSEDVAEVPPTAVTDTPKPRRGRKPKEASTSEPMPADHEIATAAPESTVTTETPGPEEPVPHSNTAPQASAAQWDRAADHVTFDWPAIERTAAEDGPNQAMAKLLLAARAEGANSRWPF